MVMLPTISVKMHLLTMWPMTFQPQIYVTSNIIISKAHSIHQVCKLWGHSFLVMLRAEKSNRHAQRQINRQTRKSYRRRQTKSASVIMTFSVDVVIKPCLCWSWNRSTSTSAYECQHSLQENLKQKTLSLNFDSKDTMADKWVTKQCHFVKFNM